MLTGLVAGVNPHRFDYAKPTRRVERFSDIDFASLAACGYNYGLFDVDNTLALRRSNVVATPILETIRAAQACGHLQGVALVSNAVWPSRRRLARLTAIRDQIGPNTVLVAAYLPRIKPHPWPFRRALDLLGATTRRTIVVGDQIFTDIAGANRLGGGIHTIWVPPLGDDAWFTRGRRAKETWVFDKIWGGKIDPRS